MERQYISWDIVEDFIKNAFIKLRVPENDAAICADVLVESDKRGIESHGCNRFKPIYVDRILSGIQNPVMPDLLLPLHLEWKICWEQIL